MITTSEGSLLTKDGYALLESQKSDYLSSSLSMKFISLDVLAASLVGAILAGVVYLVEDLSPTVAAKAAEELQVHVVMGIILGFVLTSRIFIGSTRAYQAAACKQAFCKECRTVALLATTVTETLTISAGAEQEKQATSEFRLELVRYLNLSWYLFKAMLMEVKVVKPPPALKKKAGGSAEAQIFASKNPTLMVVKFMAKLLQSQLAAGRIAAAEVPLFWSSFTKMVEIYHETQSLALSAPSVALQGFCYFFTFVWVYTLCPVLAITMQSENPGATFPAGGFLPTLFGSFFVGLFFFGLLEAGKLVEKPIKAMVAVSDLEGLTVALSEDLTSLIDDPDGEVPVFLPSPSVALA